MDERIDILLTRKALGVATPDEEAELRAWTAGDPGRARAVEAILARTAGKGAAADADVDVDAAWAAVQGRLEGAEARPPATPHRAFHRTRAAVLPIAAILVVGAAGALAVEAFPEPPGLDIETTVLRDVGTSRGEMRPVVLADGSRVILAPESRIRYPSAFTGPTRDVTVTGRAFLDVAPLPDRPFRIGSGEARVTVLGTRFVVRSYPGEDGTEVAVEEGSVALARAAGPDDAGPGAEDGGRVVLEAGDLGRLGSAAAAPVRIPRGAGPAHFAWRQGRLVFDDTPMSTVLAELTRFYDMDFGAPPEVLARRVSFSIDEQSQDQVLELLSLLLDLDVRRDGAAVRLEPRPVAR